MFLCNAREAISFIPSLGFCDSICSSNKPHDCRTIFYSSSILQDQLAFDLLYEKHLPFLHFWLLFSATTKENELILCLLAFYILSFTKHYMQNSESLSKSQKLRGGVNTEMGTSTTNLFLNLYNNNSVHCRQKNHTLKLP